MRKDIKEWISLRKQGKMPEGYIIYKDEMIPNNFTIATLGELVDFQNGINAKKEKFGYGIKIISVSDVLQDGPIYYETIRGNIDITVEQLKSYSVNYGDILFQRSSENIEDAGKANVYLDEENTATFGGFVIRGKRKKDYNPIVINEILKMHYVRKQSMKLAAGSQHINIGQNELSKIWIAIPDKEQQKQIEKLTKIYFIKEKLINQLIIAKEEEKEFVAKLLLSGKRRLSGFSRKWKVVRMEDVFSERVETNAESAELLSITSKGIVPRSQLDGKDISSDDKRKYKKIYKGDIGYNTMRMWQGVSALSYHEGIVSPAYTVLVPKENIDANFFSYLFKLPSSIFMFYRYSQGLVDDTRNLKFEYFKKIKFYVPSDINEQREIANLLRVFDKQIELLKKKNELIIHEKKAVMQLLLMGIVRVND